MAASSATYFRSRRTHTEEGCSAVGGLDPVDPEKAGRQRNTDARAHTIRAALGSEQLSAPPAITAAVAATTTAAVGLITELNRQLADLETTLADHFETHPDADIYRSLPGLGVILGARVLGEFGDDPNRYTTAKCRKTTPEPHR